MKKYEPREYARKEGRNQRTQALLRRHEGEDQHDIDRHRDYASGRESLGNGIDTERIGRANSEDGCAPNDGGSSFGEAADELIAECLEELDTIEAETNRLNQKKQKVSERLARLQELNQKLNQQS